MPPIPRPQILRFDRGQLGVALPAGLLSSAAATAAALERLSQLSPLDLAATAAIRLDLEESPEVPEGETAPEVREISVLGYWQTEKPACEGGEANANGFRIRNGGFRRFARSFAGQPFITGHDWGDVTKRGGIITRAWAEVEDAKLLSYQLVRIKAPWAIEALEYGQIDRFSIGAATSGEIRCTVHDSPVWEGDCWCWPGMEMDDGTIAEWEYQHATGVELSAVNVPAVDGTGYEEVAELLAEMTGRRVPRELAAQLRAGAGAHGLCAARGARRTMSRNTTPTKENQMDREKKALSLGLAADATWEQIAAEQERRNSLLQGDANDSYFAAQVASVRETHVVTDEAAAQLRAVAGTGAAMNRAAFDSALALLKMAAAKKVPPAPEAEKPAGGTLSSLPMGKLPNGGGLTPTAEADKVEKWSQDPEVAKEIRRMMKLSNAAGVRITEQDIRDHGPDAVNVISDDVISATKARGE